MPRSFKLNLPPAIRKALGRLNHKDPRVTARLILGILLAGNLLAAYAVMQPLGGSAEQLEEESVTLRQQLQAARANLERTKALTAKIEQARTGGTAFLDTYFAPRRAVSSTILAELDKSARESGIRPKERTFDMDPIDGSVDLSMMTVTAAYEGSYGDLLQFVNRLDKSPKFLILDTLTATPQQGTPNLNVTVKMNSFVKAEPAATPRLTGGV